MMKITVMIIATLLAITSTRISIIIAVRALSVLVLLCMYQSSAINAGAPC